ncbi:MAG: hypothetical protein EOM91_14675 [Sphingobacteriia bacterium]|nr:hypothetical protein [Sphingobacteriia bacterium]NCC39511.1 hypothetical protein [Gammaproteobacteria bacterium]
MHAMSLQRLLTGLGLVLMVASAPAAVLVQNGPLVDASGAGADGADASTVQTAIGLAAPGFNFSQASGARLADDFVIDNCSGWQIDQIVFYGYQTGSGTTSTFTSLNLQIWKGLPGAAGSTLVFGDTTTNRLVQGTWSGIYRVLDTALTDTQRPIMELTADVGVFLPPGTYFLDWQAAGSLSSGPWAPPVTVAGVQATGNAGAFNPSAGTWGPLVDTGSAAAPQGLPFRIIGEKPMTDTLVGLNDAGEVYCTDDLVTWRQIPGNPPLRQLITADLTGAGFDDLIGLDADEAGQVFFSRTLQGWGQIPGQLDRVIAAELNDVPIDELIGLRDQVIYATAIGGSWFTIPGLLKQVVFADLDGSGVGGLAGLSANDFIYYTLDGQNWTQINGNLVDLIVADLDGVAPDDLVGLNADDDIFATQDLVNWSQIPGRLKQLVAADLTGIGRDGLVGLNADGLIFYTSDLLNWNQIPGVLNQLIAADLDGIGGADLVGLNAAGEIYYTTDLLTWEQIPGQLRALTKARF